MGLPFEIERLIGDARLDASASLGCGLEGPIGETHLVLADGRLSLFTRDSLIGTPTRHELDRGRPPRLERGDFSDTLHIELADGASHALNVSSFERDAVTKLIAACAAPLASAPAPAVALSAPAPEAPQAPPLEAPPATAVESGSRTEPAAVEAEPDPQAGKSVATYRSNDMGCVSCLLQLALLLAPAVGMWWVQDPAMAAIGAAEGSAMDWVTEVLAIIGGLYIGWKVMDVVPALSRRGNWQGCVEVKGDVARVIGPRGKWEVVIDGRHPFAVRLEAVTPTGAATDAQGAPVKRSFKYVLHVEQDGHAAALRAGDYAEKALPAFAGFIAQQIAKEPEMAQALLLKLSDFEFVARRLRDLPRKGRK